MRRRIKLLLFLCFALFAQASSSRTFPAFASAVNPTALAGDYKSPATNFVSADLQSAAMPSTVTAGDCKSPATKFPVTKTFVSADLQSAALPSAATAGDYKFPATKSLVTKTFVSADLQSAAAEDTAVHKKKNFFNSFLDYFRNANKNVKHKKFDFSVIGGPHYSSAVGLGLGIMASGLYYPARDTLVPPSNITIFGDVATSGFCLIGVSGNNLLKGDRYRLNYKMYLYSFPTLYYGTGYEAGLDKDHKSSYKRFQSRMQVTFLVRLARAFFAGPQLSWDYVHGTDATHPEYWAGQDMTISSFSPGLTVSYDTRDNLTAPYKGLYINFNQRFFLKGLGNGRYHFNSSELTANCYTPLWKGAVLAAQVHGLFNYGGEVPWFQMASVGGNSSMRGYFEGRYRDKNMVDGQVELRQRVWKRHGVVVWCGAANVFPELKAMRLRETLPNYGFGYRWEFKKRVNIRLDYGFGKHISGFLFNINEAF